MCDTFIVSKNKSRFFLKNSDRSPNEPNLLEYVPRKEHKEKMVECTYISIPQVKETYGCFLVKPSWMFGAEMGVNEYGVAIGNEAVFTKHHNKKETLIGMDYLRLALERSKTAREAKNVIIDLLKEYDQGGNCGYDHKFYYNNSYLIADKDETFILETVNKDYCVHYELGSYNISNRLSIVDDYQESSKKFKNFKKENSDFIFTVGSMSKDRECKGKTLINKAESLEDMIKVLSSHRIEDIDIKGDTGSICMHKNALGDHTTGSMIMDLSKKNPTIWVSGGMSPCQAVFKPYYLGLETSFVKNNDFDRLYYYMDRMYLNRIVLSHLIDNNEYTQKKNELQEYLINKERSLRNEKAPISEFYKFSEEADKLEQELVESYRDKIEEVKKNPDLLKGIWVKVTKNLAKDPFSKDLNTRLGK